MCKFPSFFFVLALSMFFISADSQTVYITENFNSGIPISWSTTTPTCFNSVGDTTEWEGTTLGWRGQGLAAYSLDNTEFAVVDSDEPGVFCQCNEFMTTPVFDATASSTLFLEFQQFFRYYTGGFAETGEVQVYNGSAWITVASFTSTNGAWTAPNQQAIDITPYINATMQVRFRYNANWDWFWAIDNVRIAENTLTGTYEDRSTVLFDIFPNPSTGKFTLRTTELSTPGIISVCNMIGQTVLKSDTPDLQYTVVDLSALPDGVYFLSVKTAKGEEVKKIIKTNSN